MIECFSDRSTVKLTTLVDFPPYGFDMAPHVCPSHTEGDRRCVWSPWRRHRVMPPPHALPDEYVYDLYAVCNHHGQDLQSGHYTGKALA